MPDVGYMSAADINNSIGVGYTGPQGQNVLNNIFGNFGSTQGQYAPYPMFGEPSGMGTMQQPMQQPAYGYGSLYNSADDPNSAGRQQQRVNDPDEYNRWFSQWQGLHGGTGGAPSPAPGSLMPSAPMQMPDTQRLLGYNPNTGYNPGSSNPADDPNSPGRQQQRANDPNEFNRWLNQYNSLHGGASPMALGPLPPLSLGWPGQSWNQKNFDPQFDRSPESVLGHPGTLDRNSIDPNQRPSLNYNDPRDRIAHLMASQVPFATS